MTVAIKFPETNTVLCADGYIPIPEENVIQFYIEKSDLDFIPPIKVDADMLTDFGKEILCQ